MPLESKQKHVCTSTTNAHPWHKQLWTKMAQASSKGLEVQKEEDELRVGKMIREMISRRVMIIVFTMLIGTYLIVDFRYIWFSGHTFSVSRTYNKNKKLECNTCFAAGFSYISLAFSEIIESYQLHLIYVIEKKAPFDNVLVIGLNVLTNVWHDNRRSIIELWQTAKLTFRQIFHPSNRCNDWNSNCCDHARPHSLTFLVIYNPFFNSYSPLNFHWIN